MIKKATKTTKTAKTVKATKSVKVTKSKKTSKAVKGTKKELTKMNRKKVIGGRGSLMSGTTKTLLGSVPQSKYKSRDCDAEEFCPYINDFDNCPYDSIWCRYKALLYRWQLTRKE